MAVPVREASYFVEEGFLPQFELFPSIWVGRKSLPNV